jgi:phenylacetate-CoA ligase
MSAIRKLIAKRLAYPLQDWYNKTSILSTHRFLLESQAWTESQILDYQFSKFKKLLDHAYRNVPYYTSLFKSVSLNPIDIRCFDDVNKIPILTKENARKENENLIAQNLPKNKALKGFTGGTTGPPLKLLRDSSDLTFTWAAFFRWYTWMGIEIGDPVTKIWGTRTVLSRPLKRRIADNIKNYYYNRNMVNSFNLNDNTIKGVINQFNKFKPSIIRGYLSAFIQIAEYMKENNLELDFKPKAISSTTETLLDPFRQLIQKQFNAPLYDQYGCGECNSIAFEAGDGLGMYVASEHVYLEITNDSYKPEQEKEGKIIVTNLDNYIMPFIRYENGDNGQFAKDVSGKKFNLPLLKSISGRTIDTITLANGSKVHGVFFTDILRELFQENPDYIHRFQVYQDTPGEIEFRIESKKKPDDTYIANLKSALTRYFTSIEIRTLDNLPLDSSGKFRYVISSLRN